MNLIECKESVKNDITSDTKKNETNIECDIIGKRKRNRPTSPTLWNKICEKCGKVIYYTTKGNLNYSIKVKRNKCLSCVKTEHQKNIIYRRNCPKCNKELTYSCYITYIRQERKNKLCVSCTQDWKKNIGPFIRKCPVCNDDIISKDKRQRDRSLKRDRLCLSCSISRKNRLRHQRDRARYGKISVPCFNRKSCGYFDNLNNQNNWELQHALNGGEYYLKDLGYWLDGYDKKRNIAIEYDEKYHYTKNGELKKKDIDRMNEICHYLKCRFYRYNENKGTLNEYEYTTNTTTNGSI